MIEGMQSQVWMCAWMVISFLFQVQIVVNRCWIGLMSHLRFLEFCYGRSGLFICLGHVKRTYNVPTLKSELLWRCCETRCVFQLQFTLWEQCIFRRVEDRTADLSLPVVADRYLYYILLSNERAFLAVGILEYFVKLPAPYPWAYMWSFIEILLAVSMEN